VASASLITALVRHDFNVEYVASYTSRNLPLAYTVASFYGGQAGSLLFWAVVQGWFAAAALWLTPRRYAHLLPYVAGVTCAIILFFVVVMLFAANPFDRLPYTPMDGRGLNPQFLASFAGTKRIAVTGTADETDKSFGKQKITAS
jgi:cytochrome c-type biogenesis protein CcmF